MKLVKHAVITAAMILAPQVHASPITSQFNDFAGDFTFEGSFYQAPIGSSSNEVRGIGFISEILNHNNQVVWSSGQGGSWINFVYDDFAKNTGTGASFTANLGNVSFYDSSSNIFSATGNWIVDAANIISHSNPAFASLDGAIRALNTTMKGEMNTNHLESKSGLNVAGGSHGANFDTISEHWGPNLVDMTMKLEGDKDNALGYSYAGDAEFKGEIAVVSVPEPGILMLMGLGFLVSGFHFRAKRFIPA